MPRAALVMAALACASCATTPPPDCPDAQVKRFVCDNGQKTLTYDAALDPARYCQAVGDLASRAPVAQRRDPPIRLTDGVRAMYTGLSGWLLFPVEKDLTDSPAQLRQWFQLRNCVPVPPA